jgi:hypothetical protein
VAGGNQNIDPSNAEVFDGTSWTVLTGVMSSYRNYPCVVSLPTALLAGGDASITISTKNPVSTTQFLFELGSQISAGTPMSTTRSTAAAVSCRGRLYVTGGRNTLDDAGLTSVEWTDAFNASSSWNTGVPFNSARSYHAAVASQSGEPSSDLFSCTVNRTCRR